MGLSPIFGGGGIELYIAMGGHGMRNIGTAAGGGRAEKNGVGVVIAGIRGDSAGLGGYRE